MRALAVDGSNGRRNDPVTDNAEETDLLAGASNGVDDSAFAAAEPENAEISIIGICASAAAARSRSGTNASLDIDCLSIRTLASPLRNSRVAKLMAGRYARVDGHFSALLLCWKYRLVTSNAGSARARLSVPLLTMKSPRRRARSRNERRAASSEPVKKLPAIDIQNISVRFRTPDGPLSALEDISAHIEPRSFLTVVGPSGCGKTTLLKVLSGVLPPSAGEVCFDGRPLKQAAMTGAYRILCSSARCCFPGAPRSRT